MLWNTDFKYNENILWWARILRLSIYIYSHTHTNIHSQTHIHTYTQSYTHMHIGGAFSKFPGLFLWAMLLTPRKEVTYAIGNRQTCVHARLLCTNFTNPHVIREWERQSCKDSAVSGMINTKRNFGIMDVNSGHGVILKLSTYRLIMGRRTWIF